MIRYKDSFVNLL